MTALAPATDWTAYFAPATARLRPRVFDALDGMPRRILARELGISVSTLSRYTAGEVTPEGCTEWKSPGALDRLAGVIGCRTVDLLEFLPRESDGGRPNHASYSPCPSWCSDHYLLAVHNRKLPRGEVEVMSNLHRRTVRHGRLAVTLQRYGDADPAEPWSRTLLDVDGIESENLRAGLVGAEDWRWLGDELATITLAVTGQLR